MRYIFCLRYLLVLFVFLCTACGTALPTVKPYKLDVQQGNVVTSKMLLQLRPGMTKSQVRFIMGTPLIQDSFHGNRWDYVYQLREKGKIIEQRRVILDFENELLKAVRGDVIPAGSGPKGEETSNTGTRTVPPVDKAKDKSFMDKLKFWKKDDVAPAPITPANQNKPVAPQAVPAPVSPTPSAPPAEPSQPAEETAPAEESRSILTVPMEVPAPPAEPAPNTDPAETTQQQPSAEPEKVPSEPSDTPSVQEAPPQTSPSVVKPASAPPARADNQKAPPPKDLPEESDPDFFERMLEKIGF